MATAWLSLGANLGEPDLQLRRAVDALGLQSGIEIRSQSATLTTAAWGKTDQPDFRNLVLEVDTTLAPLELLDACLAVEADLGRIRRERWGPRLIDIDIIAYDRQMLSSDRLTLPHPFAHERDFVLAPLREIAPEVADWIVERRR